MKIKAGSNIDPSRLTQRERQVLGYLVTGFSDKEIAQKIRLAPSTVQRHVENVRNKLGARNRAHLVVQAHHWDLVRS